MARKTHRRKYHHRRSHGGVAPASHDDIGWSSKMSLGQGDDYLKYHVGQHGGAALQGADLSSLGSEGLPSSLRSSAMLGGLDKAFGEIQGLRDQSGGKRRRRRSHRRRSQHHRRRSQHHRRRSQHHRRRSQHRRHSQHRRRSHRRRRGGALAHAPFPSQGMLLGSSIDYARAGLNPHWNDVEADAARARAAM